MRVDTLIVGGGFGGAFCARELERLLRGRNKRIVLVAPNNFLLFSPLLPEAAAGTLEPRHAVIPLRELLKDTTVVIGEVVGVDPSSNSAVVRDINGAEHDVEFETAVLAPGSVPAVFPIPGLSEHAVAFKTLADAIWLRNRVLHQLDAAAATSDPDARERLLTFTFVGGGYAGVEAIAELESLAVDALKRYPNLNPADFRWVLVEAQDTLLHGIDPKLARFTDRTLSKRGIEVHLGTRLESCADKRIHLANQQVRPYVSETIVWTAGQMPSPLAADWGLPTDDRGFVPVDERLRVEQRDDLYAVGDVAAVPDVDGGLSPNTAQHAMRQGRVAAINVAAYLGAGDSTVFDYRSRGLAVTLGKRQGTAQVRRWTFTGPLAWWMGRSYHLLMMPGIARKSRVLSDWTMGLLFPRDVSQLGQLGNPSPLE